MYQYYANTAFDLFRIMMAHIVADSEIAVTQNYCYQALRYLCLAILEQQGVDVEEFDNLHTLLQKSRESSHTRPIAFPALAGLFAKQLDAGDPAIPLIQLVDFVCNALHVTTIVDQYKENARLYFSVFKHGNDIEMESFALNEYRETTGEEEEVYC